MILVGQDSGSLVHKSIMLNYLFTYTSNKEFCETFNIYPNQGIFFKSLKVCKNVQLQTVRNEICVTYSTSPSYLANEKEEI